MATPIGTLGTVETLTVGGFTFVSPRTSGLLVLYGKVHTNTNTTFRKIASGVTSGYAVTTGKTLTIYALKGINGATSAQNMELAQSDNDVGLDSATALTNPVYLGGGTGDNGSLQFAATSGVITEYPVFFQVAALKYLSGAGTAATDYRWFAYGYEA